MKLNWLYLILFFISSISCSKSENKTNVPLPFFRVNIDRGEYVATQIGESVELTASVEAAGEYSYEWKIDNKIISQSEVANIKSEEIGITKVYLEVTRLADMKNAIKKTEIFYAKKQNYKIIGYFPSYKNTGAKNQVKWNKITHICYSFLIPTTSGGFNDKDVESKLSPVVSDGHDNGVYVLISMGGGGTGSFSEAILNENARKNLVKNTVDFILKNNIDGVDVDFEEWDGGPTGASSKDIQKRGALEKFYKELREAMPKDRLLTVAVSASWKNPNWGYFNCYTESMHQYWDFAGIMTYDVTGTYPASPYGQHASMEEYELSINHWLHNMNLPKEKLIPGVPFYGYRFKNENGGLAEGVAYKDIIKAHKDEDVPMKDHVGLTFYNGIPTITQKCEYVKTHSLGGIMIWELTQDSDIQEESLLDAIKLAFDEVMY